MPRDLVVYILSCCPVDDRYRVGGDMVMVAVGLEGHEVWCQNYFMDVKELEPGSWAMVHLEMG